MKTDFLRRAIFLLFALSLLIGCRNDAPEEASPISPEDLGERALTESDGPIDIEGNLVPGASVSLSFSLPGSVHEVLVREGESVAAGQVLARLGDRRQAEAGVAASELELLVAQQDLQAVRDNHAAVLNQALLALIASRQDVEDAQRVLDAITGARLENAIASAEARLVLASDNLEKAEDAFSGFENEDEADPTRASFQLRLAEARQAHDEAVRLLDDLQGDGYAFRLRQAQDTLLGAQDQLSLAEEHYADVSAGPDSSALALAEARIAAAEAGLAAAQAGLEQHELRAPLAGTVVELGLTVGEQVAAGQPVVRVADLSEWLVETIDLTEIDVVSIDAAQPVRVTPDALPDVTMTGTILSIANVPREVRGDVTYVARIRLDTVDPRLRWGMTVLVSFQLPGATGP